MSDLSFEEQKIARLTELLYEELSPTELQKLHRLGEDNYLDQSVCESVVTGLSFMMMVGNRLRYELSATVQEEDVQETFRLIANDYKEKYEYQIPRVRLPAGLNRVSLLRGKGRLVVSVDVHSHIAEINNLNAGSFDSYDQAFQKNEFIVSSLCQKDPFRTSLKGTFEYVERTSLQKMMEKHQSVVSVDIERPLCDSCLARLEDEKTITEIY